MEHAFTIGIALLVTLLVAGIVWFSMSRSSSGSKAEVLVNQARVNGATTDAPPLNQEAQEEEIDNTPTVPYGTPQEVPEDHE